MRALASLGQRPWAKDPAGWNLSATLLSAARNAGLHQEQEDRWTGSPRTTVPCSLETGAFGPGESPRREEWCICSWWFKGGIFSEAPFLCSSSLPPQQACPLSPSQVHPMTPSLGVTPDEAQLPAGPPAHRVAIFGQFPVLWARLSGEQILGLDLPGEWVRGLDLSLGGSLPLPLFSSSPIAVNISTK